MIGADDLPERHPKRHQRLVVEFQLPGADGVSEIRLEVDLAAAQLLQAQASVKQAEATLADAKLQLTYTKVTSPIQGRVSRQGAGESAHRIAEKQVTGFLGHGVFDPRTVLKPADFLEGVRDAAGQPRELNGRRISQVLALTRYGGLDHAREEHAYRAENGEAQADEYDRAAALAAATGVDLSLDDAQLGAELVVGGFGLLGGLTALVVG